MKRVTLSDAIAAGDLEPFIRQAETDGVGPVNGKAFNLVSSTVIKAPRPARRTSRSRVRGGSAET